MDSHLLCDYNAGVLHHKIIWMLIPWQGMGGCAMGAATACERQQEAGRKIYAHCSLSTSEVPLGRD